MALRFNGAWRFNPPEDGRYYNRSIPYDAVEEFIAMVAKVATQGRRQEVLEHFKGHFCVALGTTHFHSSNESWAETDLRNDMHSAADNAPLFLEAFFDACEDLRRRNADWFIPDATLMKLHRSEQLLSEGHPREAVQEILWLLETVTTAFRGIETESGTVEGKYFNQIVRDLRVKRPGTTLDRVLEWVTSVHGYLSSPTGGGVRHGLDLSQGVELDANEARLFCNLIRSYLAFLLAEHERLYKRAP
jgi:hypothetical protein